MARFDGQNDRDGIGGTIRYIGETGDRFSLKAVRFAHHQLKVCLALRRGGTFLR